MPDKFDARIYMPDISDCPKPTLTIDMSRYFFNVEDTAIVTFTFSEQPFGFTKEDVTVQNGLLSDFTVTENPLVYTAIFTPFNDILDYTNVIMVGTGWVNWAYKPPEGITISDNYVVSTIGYEVRITTDDDIRVTFEGDVRIIGGV